MELYQKKDLHPQASMAEIVADFFQDMKKRERQKGTCSKEEFTFLLSGIPTLRNVPGIEGMMGYRGLYHCPDEKSQNQVKAHLEHVFGVHDKESLLHLGDTACKNHEQYQQFQSYWENHPIFDEDDLSEKGKIIFNQCKEFASQFRNLLGDRGFFAWDCGEFIGHCRVACACGLISEPEFWDLVAPWVMRASLMFDNWVDYAVSCACGGVYFMYRESGGSEKGLEDFLRLNLGAAMQLLQNPQIWGDDRWFSPPVKAFKIPPKEIKPVLKNWSGPPACLATDRILVDGCKVGYMYREKPQDENTPDSGWRFFAGDETEEYVNDPAHVAFYHLNTICNYDPDILPLLNSPYGSAFGRDKDGILVGKNRK